MEKVGRAEREFVEAYFILKRRALRLLLFLDCTKLLLKAMVTFGDWIVGCEYAMFFIKKQFPASARCHVSCPPSLILSGALCPYKLCKLICFITVVQISSRLLKLAAQSACFQHVFHAII